MDYTPIGMSRVLMAFACTGFVALLPPLFMWLQSGHDGLLSAFADTEGGYGDLVLGAGSVALTASLIGALMFAIALGRRMVRRPSRA
ncbi:hypothetical protein C6I20_13285 [Aeromicrobium sp. A1-2]|uniref:hypothetical protein n=1 Tax=Aeromicrobium sp. A1-2 TaxID=2107713 RepID=UPI000E49AA20|nr:hypothetical protein [Aeromicrobium sp. A1-2]AXT86061.1 hypothetical protein C6I20_13285 [Aeromicrobium sp. A1-2]